MEQMKAEPTKKVRVIHGFISGVLKVGERALIIDRESELFYQTSTVRSIEIRGAWTNASDDAKDEKIYSVLVRIETDKSVYLVTL